MKTNSTDRAADWLIECFRRLFSRRFRLVTGPDEYGSVYVYFQRHRRGGVARTVQGMAKVLVDYDAKGRLYGIEVLDCPARIKSQNDVEIKDERS